MYSKLPNIIIAFHGCDKEIHDKVLYEHASLLPSNNIHDWLGNGIYFWESNRQRALEWAEEKVGKGNYNEASVLGAIIDLGYCLNLTDSAYVPILQMGYDLLKIRLGNEGKTMPANRLGNDKLIRELDCSVIEQIHYLNFQTNNREFDSVRGVFIEGDEIYEGSGFRNKTHIQICIKNENCIKGYFEPLLQNEYFPLP